MYNTFFCTQTHTPRHIVRPFLKPKRGYNDGVLQLHNKAGQGGSRGGAVGVQRWVTTVSYVCARSPAFKHYTAKQGINKLSRGPKMPYACARCPAFLTATSFFSVTRRAARVLLASSRAYNQSYIQWGGGGGGGFFSLDPRRVLVGNPRTYRRWEQNTSQIQIVRHFETGERCFNLTFTGRCGGNVRGGGLPEKKNLLGTAHKGPCFDLLGNLGVCIRGVLKQFI